MSGRRAEEQEGIEVLLGGLAASLAQVLESMTDSRPDTSWEAAAGTPAEIDPGPGAEMFWWRQRFQIMPEPALWVGAPRATWEELGGRTLRAAGLEEVDSADARNTWLEILNQALAATARLASGRLGEEVTCAEGEENPPPAGAGQWFRIVLSFEQPLAALWVLPSPALAERLEHAAEAADQDSAARDARGGQDQPPVSASGRTMELLLDVELPVSLSFGRSQVPLKDVLKLTTGSIVELNRGVSEPVDVLVNQCLVARGEVVVIDGNYAVRIQQIVSPQERLRTVR